MKKCAVIGSINMDMVIGVPRFPQPGETLTGRNFETVPGGKGANQAVALARLGADVRMAGLVGDDAFGGKYLEHFKANGVNVSAVGVEKGCSTGVADILVHQDGENFIVIVPGANGKCDIEWLDRTMPLVEDCDIFLLQLEIPLETVKECIRRLKAMGKTVILDPAPAVPLDEEVLKLCDYITPNETELKIITPMLDEDSGVEERVKWLVGDSERIIIHKHGAEGAYVGTRSGVEHIPGYKVKAVDTTAAGDTFNAGFAAGLAMGWDVKDAVKLANAAGALAVTKLGAQAGMPSLEEARALMERG